MRHITEDQYSTDATKPPNERISPFCLIIIGIFCGLHQEFHALDRALVNGSSNDGQVMQVHHITTPVLDDNRLGLTIRGKQSLKSF